MAVKSGSRPQLRIFDQTVHRFRATYRLHPRGTFRRFQIRQQACRSPLLDFLWASNTANGWQGGLVREEVVEMVEGASTWMEGHFGCGWRSRLLTSLGLGGWCRLVSGKQTWEEQFLFSDGDSCLVGCSAPCSIHYRWRLDSGCSGCGMGARWSVGKQVHVLN